MKTIALILLLASPARAVDGTSLRGQDFRDLVLPSTLTVTGPQTEISTLTVVGKDASGNSVKLSSGLAMPLGTITANMFKGNGSELTGISAVTVLPSTIAYTDKNNVFTASQTIAAGAGLAVNYGIAAGSATLAAGLTASSGTFTQSGATAYSVYTASGLFVASGTIVLGQGGGVKYFDGSISTTAAFSQSSGTSSSNSVSTFTGGVIYNPLTIAGSSLTVTYGVIAGSASISGGLQASSGTFTQTGTYSVFTASGMNVNTGIVNIGSASGGVRYFDGSISTTAAFSVSSNTASGQSFVVLASPGNGNFLVGVADDGALTTVPTASAAGSDIFLTSPGSIRFKLGVANDGSLTTVLSP